MRRTRHVSTLGEQGVTLIETMVALGILLVVAAGTMPLAIMSLNATENQGHLTARSAEYAQDKLEQLMALSFGDTVTDTRVFPAVPAGGSGLTVGGSSDPAAPVDPYVDYLSAEGALLASSGGPPTDWFYQRVWRIEEVGAADANCPTAVSAARICLKRITVTATVRRAVSGGPVIPSVTLASFKTYPF